MRTAAMPMKQGRVVPVRRKKTPLIHQVEKALGALLLLGVLAALLVYVPKTSYFRVEKLSFENLRVLDEATVRAAAGITIEDNILFLDGDAVAGRVETLPYVKKCEVVKSVRPNDVLLRITERKAAATVMVNNHLFEVDREFVVLRELSPYALHTGPLITNLPGLTVLEPGSRLQSPELTAALELWELFQELPLACDLTLSEVSAEGTDQLRMFFEELPYEMRWGRSDLKTQANRLAMLWDEMSGFIPCEEYLDLRFDADLVCK